MSKIMDAIYESGTLKLVKPSEMYGIKEHEQIKLIIFSKYKQPSLMLETLLAKPSIEGSVYEMAKEEEVEDV